MNSNRTNTNLEMDEIKTVVNDRPYLQSVWLTLN